MNEHAFYQLCEVDTHVVDYRAQPFRFEFVLDGEKRIYIPDCVRLLDDGAVEVVEIKGDDRHLRDPDYSAKLEYSQKLSELLDWRFRVIMKHEILVNSVRRANIQQVEQDRMTRFDDTHVYRALKAIELGGGQTGFGDIAERVQEGPAGAAVVKALMVARIVEIDLLKPLARESKVRQVKQGGAPCLL